MDIVIVGNGRSGTTVIEKTIARDLKYYALGELDLIWSRGFRQEAKCGCGELVVDCEFWSDIIKDLSSLYEKAEQDRGYKNRVISWLPIVGIFYDTTVLPPTSNYTKATEILLERLSSIDYIDSSKKPHYGNYVNSLKSDVIYFCIIRDLGAYMYSMSKKKTGNLGQQNRMIRSSYVMSIFRWVRINIRMYFIFKNKRKVIVHYENFISDPERYMRRLRELGAGGSQFASHQIAGNPSRFVPAENLELVEDVEWKNFYLYNNVCIRLLNRIIKGYLLDEAN